MMTYKFSDVSWVPGEKFLLIAGPCVIENEDLCLQIGKTVAKICKRYDIPYIFKASFDKANRSSRDSFRGHGIQEGLNILRRVKEALHVPITTDVHESHQVGDVAEVADIIQIPAFLCRQTDLLVAAGNSGKAVNVKKGQFMAPWEMKNVVAKIRATGNQQVMLTERGTFYGYNRLVNDMIGIAQMQALGAPVIFDATHSSQLPGALGDVTGGQRKFVGLLASAATAAGADGLFVEVHPHPDQSPSDAATILPLEQLENLIQRCLAIRAAITPPRA